MRSPRSLCFSYFVLLGFLSTHSSSRAIETVVNGSNSFNTTNNISSSVSGWSSGWGTGNTNTGWNYVGTDASGNGTASAVYLGSGWVLMAGHEGTPGAFTLDGNVYNTNGLYYSDFFTNTFGSSIGTSNTDLTLFNILTTSTTGTNLTLSSLKLTSNAPSIGSQVVMIGYGGASGVSSESWGTNIINSRNITQPVSGGGNTYTNIDFTTPGGTSYSALILGDSGGGAFISASGTWELAGINEAVNSGTSYFVQLSAYSSQINKIVDSVPEPGTWALLGIGSLVIFCFAFRSRGKNT